MDNNNNSTRIPKRRVRTFGNRVGTFGSKQSGTGIRLGKSNININGPGGVGRRSNIGGGGGSSINIDGPGGRSKAGTLMRKFIGIDKATKPANKTKNFFNQLKNSSRNLGERVFSNFKRKEKIVETAAQKRKRLLKRRNRPMLTQREQLNILDQEEREAATNLRDK